MPSFGNFRIVVIIRSIALRVDALDVLPLTVDYATQSRSVQPHDERLQTVRLLKTVGMRDVRVVR